MPVLSIENWSDSEMSRTNHILTKQPLKDRNIQRKTRVLEPLFYKVADLKATQVLSCESCEIFKNSYFYSNPPVAASGFS